MGKAKTLRPPQVWLNNKVGVVEAPNTKRYSPAEIRAMHHGTYDWSQHKNKAA